MNISRSSLYRFGIFTTIAVRDGELFLWEKHWRRLTGNAAKVGLDLSEHPEKTTKKALSDSLKDGGIEDGRTRITFTDERPSEIWSGREPEQNTSLDIIVGENRPVPLPYKLTVSPYPVNSRSPLAGVKSCNYLEQILAKDDAKGRGFHEAVRVNERGHVTTACMANIFWLKGHRLFTPNLSTGCLPGTTREFVLENVECEEVEVELDALSDAEAIFLTSAGLGVTRVDSFDGREMPDGFHPIQQLI